MSIQIRQLPVTARVLVRNFESDTRLLQFSDFRIEEISGRGLTAARKFFPEATQDEWILVREYDAIPPAPEAWSGFGAIPNEIEDLLTLLRLFRPGDLAFVALQLTTPSNTSRQFPYRAMSPLVSGYSTRQYILKQAECPEWELFARSLRSAAQWDSAWFAVSRRFLLYGGGKEFNANFESEVDRVIDFMTALEAALVPESDFVSRRLRERGERLLDRSGNPDPAAKRLLNQMYGVRSSLVHGSPLGSDQMKLLRDNAQWWRVEELVRMLLVEALRRVPSAHPDRRAYLASLYDLSDAERAAQLRQSFGGIKNTGVRRALIADLESDL
jgi:hypothetical protein